jgi:hypothetical protein
MIPFFWRAPYEQIRFSYGGVYCAEQRRIEKDR